MSRTSGVSRKHRKGCDRHTGCGCPWQFYVEFRTAEKVRRQVNRAGFPTRKAAVEARQQFAADYQAGKIDPGKGRLTMAEYLPMWLAQRADPHNGGRTLRASTVEGYEKHLRLYLVPRLGRVKVRDLTAEHVEGTYRWMREQGKSETLVHHVHATLRSAVTFAVQKGYLPSDDFMKRVELNKVDEYQANPWTPGEWAIFRARAEQSRYWPLLLLAVDAGMRRGELCGLRWSDVGLDEAKVTVAHTRTFVGGRVVEGRPKSGKTREVFLTPGTVTVLRSWRKQQAEERLRLGEAYTDSGLVFTDEAGAGYLPGSVSQAFDRLVEQAGVRRCRFHDLRHLSAVLGIAAGESLYEVSDRLGHSSVQITERAYAALLDDARRAAAEKRAAML